MSRYSIEESSLTAIADKIREKKYIDDEMTPAQMADELEGMGLPLGIDEVDTYWRPEPWVRPVEYPNLELIDITDFDGVYLTYDLRKTPGYGWIGIYGERKQNYPIYIERGHLDENNIFVVEEQFSIGNAAYFRLALDKSQGDIQLWRVWSEGQLLNCKFATNTTANANNFSNNMQPCVERYGRLPYVTTIASSVDTRYNYTCFTTRWLQKDNVKDVKSITTMASAYIYSVDLMEIQFDGWNTSKVTSFANCFQYCYKLRYIPLYQLATNSATTLASMFASCYSLDNADISHFNIDKVTAMNSMFEYCRSMKTVVFPENGGDGVLKSVNYMLSNCASLEELPENIEHLNVSAVTSFTNMLLACRRLKSVILNAWDVQSATTIAGMAAECYSLEYADLSGWNVSAVTTATGVFDYCMSLQKLIIDGWHLDNVTSLANFHRENRCLKQSDLLTHVNFETVTTFSYLYSLCNSLTEVSIDNQSEDNVLTSINFMFSGCYSLKRIHMPDMHFTQPITMDSTFANCHSLEDLDIGGWKIDALKAIGGFFSNCYALKEIDLTDWAITDGDLTAKNTVNSLFAGLRSCRTIKAPINVVMTNGSMSYMFDNVNASYIDISGMDLTSSSNVFMPNAAGSDLQDFYPPYLPALSLSLHNNNMLSHDSLVRILNRLPTLTSVKTITLGNTNKNKLTPEEIAIATNKGWTVA